MARTFTMLTGCRMFATAEGQRRREQASDALLLPLSICSSSWAARRHSLHFSSPPTSLFTLSSLFLFLRLFAAALHSSSHPPLSSGRIVLVRPLFVHRFEEVYEHRLSVRLGRLSCCLGTELLPGQLEPVFDLRQRSPFRRVSSFHITTIWLIDNNNSVKRG